MRLATWNINGLRARLDFVGIWLAERRPDLVGLQELKLEDDQFPHDQFEEWGYRAFVHGQKSWNGVAVLRRIDGAPETEPDVVTGLPGQEEMGARLIGTRFDDVDFLTVYCPNGKHVGHEDFPRKLDWFETLATWMGQTLEAGTTRPLVLCGDFNLCPGPHDTWSEELLQGGIFHTEEERSRFRALLDLGLQDLYRVAEPEGTQFSWWDYRAGAFHKNHGLRIDFLLGTEPIAQRVDSAWTDRDFRKKKDGLTASDHAPVIADLAS